METRTRFIHEHKLSFVVLVVELNPLNLTSRYSQTLIKLIEYITWETCTMQKTWRIFIFNKLTENIQHVKLEADVGGDSLQTS